MLSFTFRLHDGLEQQAEPRGRALVSATQIQCSERPEAGGGAARGRRGRAVLASPCQRFPGSLGLPLVPFQDPRGCSTQLSVVWHADVLPSLSQRPCSLPTASCPQHVGL